MQLDIDDELYERLRKRAERQGFASAEEYSIIILETVLDELENIEDDNDIGSNNDVQSRLEDLGYLD